MVAWAALLGCVLNREFGVIHWMTGKNTYLLWWIVILMGLAGVGVFVALWPMIGGLLAWPAAQWELGNAALLGDSFGVVNAIVSALAFFLLWRANRMQSEELALQRQDYQEQAEQTKLQLKLMEAQLKDSASAAEEAKKQTEILRRQYASQGRAVFRVFVEIGETVVPHALHGLEEKHQGWLGSRTLDVRLVNVSKERAYVVEARLERCVPDGCATMIGLDDLIRIGDLYGEASTGRPRKPTAFDAQGRVSVAACYSALFDSFAKVSKLPVSFVMTTDNIATGRLGGSPLGLVVRKSFQSASIIVSSINGNGIRSEQRLEVIARKNWNTMENDVWYEVQPTMLPIDLDQIDS